MTERTLYAGTESVGSNVTSMTMEGKGTRTTSGRRKKVLTGVWKLLHRRDSRVYGQVTKLKRRRFVSRSHTRRKFDLNRYSAIRKILLSVRLTCRRIKDGSRRLTCSGNTLYSPNTPSISPLSPVAFVASVGAPYTWSNAKLGETRSPGLNFEVAEPVRTIFAAQSEPGMTDGFVGRGEPPLAITRSLNCQRLHKCNDIDQH